MRGIVLEEVSKEELINSLKGIIEDEVLVLMSTSEAAALLGVTRRTINEYHKAGKLKDYSTHNQHQKYSAKDVLKLRRDKQN